MIYRARDVRLNRDVAIKLLPDKAVTDSGAVARFRVEAQAASALNHPHILTIYDIGETDEPTPRRFIAMEYIAGQTLRAHIAKKRGVDEIIEQLIQIAEGPAKAHEADIVHRDLKPDNIMVTADGYAKILDFGLAKLIDPRGSDSDATTRTGPSTEPGTIVGTPQYMSPEQISGGDVGPRSDMFAFGAVAYESLAGRRAFQGAVLAETVHQIIAVDPPPLRTFDERVPPDLQRLVTRCLAKQPSARYGTMRDVAAELKRVRQRMREGTRRYPRLVQLTFARAIEQFPALSPDGTQLVFARDIGRLRKLVLSEPAESSERPLTRGEFDDIHPAWSPDAANVLFHVVNERHLKKRPMIFTTNKLLAAWGAVLHDPDLAEAIIDRILERGRFLALDGPSSRTRHLKLDELLATKADEPQLSPARISGKRPAEFPEPARTLVQCWDATATLSDLSRADDSSFRRSG